MQFDVGKVDFLLVLQRQGQVVATKVNLLNIQDQRLQQRVDLHLALGGSFDEKPAAQNGDEAKVRKETEK